MKRLLPVILILAACVGEAQDFSQPISKAKAQISKLLNEYPGVSIAVGHKGSIIWAEGFGYADASADKQVNPEHRFLYYSLSKSILGLAIYKQVRNGAIDLDVPITKYDSTLPDQFSRVSSRHLLGHTSGIRHYNKGEWMKLSTDQCDSPSDALDVFINDPLQFQPGTKIKYSSFGYVLVSHILEAATKTSFDNYVKKELFEPLSLGTIERPLGTSKVDNQVVRYKKWDPEKKKGKNFLVNNSCKFGGRGFVGSARDLVKLHMNQLARDPTFFQSLNEEHIGVYGFGLGISEDRSYYIHTGSGAGGSGAIVIYPEKELVLVMLGNIEANGIKSNIRTVADVFLKPLE